MVVALEEGDFADHFLSISKVRIDDFGSLSLSSFDVNLPRCNDVKDSFHIRADL